MKRTICSKDKTAKQPTKQPISTNKQIDKNVNDNMALVTNTAINSKHPGLTDNTMNINPSSMSSPTMIQQWTIFQTCQTYIAVNY